MDFIALTAKKCKECHFISLTACRTVLDTHAGNMFFEKDDSERNSASTQVHLDNSPVNSYSSLPVKSVKRHSNKFQIQANMLMSSSPKYSWIYKTGCKKVFLGLPADPCFKCLIFTALHAMQTRYCEENSVRPSVRPSHA